MDASHREAAFHYYVNCLLHIPMELEAFHKEVHVIKQLASSNNININIDRLIHTKRTCTLLDLTTSLHRGGPKNKRLRWVWSPY